MWIVVECARLALSHGVRLISRRASLGILIALAVVIAIACSLIPRIPQPLSYHQFADHRSFLGITNFGDVASNLPFALVGIWGLAFLFRNDSADSNRHFIDPLERWPYFFVFFGLVLTAFGSSYYHLAPDNARLVWDRLPMTITFMGLVAAIITERISVRLGLYLLPALLLIGMGSVVQWHWSEVHGVGDLRFYASVQAYSTVVVLLAFLFPRRYTRTSDLWLVVGFYVLAKLLETFDRPIFAVLQVVSGHTLKHLAAAAAGYRILRMLERREPVSATSGAPSVAFFIES
jgi:hypothetical protein